MTGDAKNLLRNIDSMNKALNILSLQRCNSRNDRRFQTFKTKAYLQICMSQFYRYKVAN